MDLFKLVLNLPIACAYRGRVCNMMVLPVIGGELAREHEERHLQGFEHDGSCVS